MFEIHNSQDGPILISQMGDEHLVNTIKMFCTRITQVRIAGQTPQDNDDDYSRALYNIRKMDPETAGQTNRIALTKLYPYLAEATLRGLDIRQHLINAVGRDKGLGHTTMLLSDPDLEDLDF